MNVTEIKLNNLANEGTVMGPFKVYRENGSITISYYDEVISIEGARLVLPAHNRIKELVKEHTTVIIGDYNTARNTVDALYNHFVDSVTKSNGVLKESAKREVHSRMRNYETPYLNHFLNKVIKAGMDPLDISTNLSYIHDYTTNSKVYFSSYVTGLISGAQKRLPRGYDLANLGYIKEVGSRDTNWLLPDEPMETINGIRYRSSTIETCIDCGARSPTLHAGLCQTCLGIDPAMIVIRGYQERAPSFIDYKLGKYSKSLYKDPLYFGIEIEYESDNQDKALLDTARLLGKHAIFKRDGSISHGFEIVTTPATLDHQKEAFKAFFDKFPKNLQAQSNTGMHVHISRSPLSMLTQGKLVEFMNRTDNKAFIEAIAGRSNNHYTKQDTSRKISYPFLNKQGDRYNTLNINNEATLEFRIFSSPESWKDFEPKLEFVDALTAYCSPCQAKGVSITEVTHHRNFVDYVKQHATTWKALAEFLGLTKPSESQARLNTYLQLKLSKGTA